jgi:UDP-N-acetylmuramate dehydrogenase
VRGLTILNRCRRVEIRADRRIYVESGAPLAGLARETIQASLSGLEWAIGVPGTIGGAIVGNAGAHGGCIADHLHAIEMLHPTGERAVYPAEELGLSYRSSRLKTGELRGVILSATFQMLPEAPEVLRERAEAYLAHRRKSQPVDASAGSIFRNPPGDFAGRLIEEAGLKGAREGAAQISPIHANFIVNLGGATAADVIRLIRRAQSAVYERFGVRLEPEIQMVGDWGIRDWEIRD